MHEPLDIGNVIIQVQVETLRDAANDVPVDLWTTYGTANRRHVEGFKDWLRERADRLEKGESVSEGPWDHHGHNPVQHRDNNPPWCSACGWSSPTPAQPARFCKERHDA